MKQNLDIIFDRPLNEQETTISQMRTEDTVEIYTSDNTMWTKLKKLISSNPTQWKLKTVVYDADGHATGCFVEAPKELIHFSSKKREISQARKEAAAQRMKQYHAMKE